MKEIQPRIVKENTSAAYRSATNEYFLKFYRGALEPLMSRAEIWEKWHNFETNDGTVDFVCPLAYTEHCYTTGHQQEAKDCFERMAEKPWEKKFVKILEQYGERRRGEYITRMRMGISEMDRLI